MLCHFRQLIFPLTFGEAGKPLVSFTASLEAPRHKDPWEPRDLVKEYEDEKAAEEVERIQELASHPEAWNE